MVVKIQPPSEKISYTLNYNENKADGIEGIHEEEIEENGHILVTRNVPEGQTIDDEFVRLRELNMKKTVGRKLVNTAFHMSINPGEQDNRLTEKEIVQLTDELMAELGYKDCPYRIYRHSDIDRIHYHVVSIRIGQDGKKINDSYENKRLMKTLEKLEQKYGFSVGNPKVTDRIIHSSGIIEKTPEIAKEAKKTEEKKYIRPFSKNRGPISEQFRLIHNEVLKWNFTTEEQYAAIMEKLYKVNVKKQSGLFTYVGLTAHKPSTPNISEDELNIDATTEVHNKIEQTLAYPSRRAQKERIQKNVTLCAKTAKNWEEFTKALEKKGIYAVLSWTESGKIFGITWLDRATKNAFKGSETSTGLNWLMNTANSSGWIVELEKRKAKTAKKTEKKKSTRHPVQQPLVGKMPTLASIASSLNNKKSHGTTTDSSDFHDDLNDEYKENKIKI